MIPLEYYMLCIYKNKLAPDFQNLVSCIRVNTVDIYCTSFTGGEKGIDLV